MPWNPVERLLAVLHRPSMSEKLMRKYAEHPDWLVRCVLAARNDLPSDLVWKLAADSDWTVRRSVADRDDLPDELVAEMVRRERSSYSVMETLAGRPRMPDELLRVLLRRGDVGVRERVASRRDLSAELVAVVESDRSPTVRRALAARGD